MIEARVIVGVLFVLFSNFLLAGEMVLSGSYQGNDLFVQNPYNPATSSFCTEAVFVNDRQVLTNPKSSAYKIDLSSFSTNDLVVIRILFQDGCKPSIVNPQVLKSREEFQFLTVQADDISISWTVKNDRAQGLFYVEKDMPTSGWTIVDTVEVKTEFNQKEYAIRPFHKKGDNQYRIKYQENEKEAIYSMEFQFTASDNYITFYPLIATTQLELSDSTDYEILDFSDKRVKQGNGKSVLLLDLKPGKYYLKIQNRREVFIKK